VGGAWIGVALGFMGGQLSITDTRMSCQTGLSGGCALLRTGSVSGASRLQRHRPPKDLPGE